MSLEEMLTEGEGITIFGTTSLKMIDGELVKVQQESKYHFPLEFLWEGRPVTVEWDSEREELVIFDNASGEIDQTELIEILKN